MSPDPVGLVAITVPSCAYMLGLSRIRHTAGEGRLVSTRQVRCFAAGMAANTVALVSPLATVAEHSVAGHMVQHVILLGVSGPLIGWGAPLPTLLWALPDGIRPAVLRRWRRVASSLGGRGYVWWLVGALFVQIGAMIAWHVPVLFDAAVRNPIVHGSEHLSFVSTSAVLWWVIAGAHRRADAGHGIAALFVESLAGIALGGAMTFAGHPWYSPYGTGAAALGSQQLAGVIMWSFGGILVLAGALHQLQRILGDDEPSPAVRLLSPAERLHDRGDETGRTDGATERPRPA